ncbi:MAG: bifunctional uridylyltransferase/uridylyl-removing protein GlnD [Pasteurellaceae bacterium]|nr:bifunctional uridylyltransferase/uridylyl-removing protein GlnD [Pasteurellaceae bacterium]
MLFRYQPETVPTPAAIKRQREQLKQSELLTFNQLPVNQLIANRTQFCDELLCHLWRYFGFAQTDLALIAVGGYGRGEMFPLSDLDFLILTNQPINPLLENNIAEFVQFLWDCGFEVGHSVRNLSQCEQKGLADISVATNLLESRFLIGNVALFEQLNQLVTQPHFWTVQDFFNAKIAEKNQRYQRYNNTSYNLEPDIKYSPGGLRDLHLIYWIALRHFDARNLAEMLHCGFIYPNEFLALQRNQQFLFRVRFALHLILKRYENRLLFDRQIKISELLGYQGAGNHAVETMMKDFFQALQSISVLSEILLKHYQEHFLQPDQLLEIRQLDSHFELANNAIRLRDPNYFQANPSAILDLFQHLCDLPDSEIHSDCLRQLHLALQQRTALLCELAPAREKFLRLFNQPRSIIRAFMPMHRYGVLAAYIPNWQEIQGLMQFDLFHTYSVDEHTLRVMQKLESFLDPENENAHPICHRIFSRLNDRDLLYISALFHDIAKGRGGDHAQLGGQDIRHFAELHGFDQQEIRTMVWLVEQHLLMSITAQRRDIQDPEVIMAFAAEVQNQVRLDLLTCLTVADICATNETLWNSWKRSLFMVLYQSCGEQFQQGIGQLLDNQDKIDLHRKQTILLLQPQYPQAVLDKLIAYWDRLPDDYFLRNNPHQIAWHAKLLKNNTKNILVKISNRFSQGGSEIFIYCSDQPHLFHNVVSTIGAKKLSIHDAQIITSKDGYAFDSFIITEFNGELLKSERRRQIEIALQQALQTNKTVNNYATPVRKLHAFQVKTEVRFLNLTKNNQTELELFALDSAGLLAKVSQIFNQLHLNLLHAKISTVGARAEDFFILTNSQNQALNADERAHLTYRLQTEL